VYENGKVRLVEIIPGIGGGGMRERVNSTMVCCNNFGKYHNVFLAHQ
jgi:hypothetical protein